MLYTYKLPTELIFGAGSLKALPAKLRELGKEPIFVVTDRGVKAAGILERVLRILEEEQFKVSVYDAIEGEPTTDLVEGVTEEVRQSGAQLVLGVGGGSALDTAKAVAAMATNGGKIFDYAGIGKIKNEPLPIVAIPTTAGTGSEATMWAVVTDREARVKTGIGSYKLMPVFAVLDPELTITMPPRVTAASGLDALCHAIESYVCTATQPISEALALQAIKLIARSLRKAVANGRDLKARADMLYASTIAALAFNVTRLGIAHALASPLGAHFGVPHGIANAILLPHVMEYNLIGAPEKFADIAAALGEDASHLPPMEAARKGVKAVEELTKDVGITDKLSSYGATEDKLGSIVEEAITSGNIAVNPRRPEPGDLLAICKKIL
ncbi:iron-containing alcohol dehydrogenase [Thermanaeromonas sp. C210]|uniref:iron-containing alcohol dehydrogenase n=1 Tax=Thermanaeromonas sp. C210 TaxID=2731925 RepID=UPI00155D55D3|nr:iron-containing alcohol dehydrogenase [Thermanaeromonas sp. C210]GFN22681.1 alcohol dehydrogenase [Thermanaeromonas sp. C210]